MNKIPKQLKNLDLLIWKDGKPMINGKAAFFFSESYGIPIKSFTDWINDLFKEDIQLKAYHTAKAYDKAHGTDYHKHLKVVKN